MLHAAELEGGHEEEVELAPGIRDARVALEPFEGRGVQVEDRAPVPLEPSRVRLAVEHPQRAPAAIRRLDRQFARGECEQVRRQRLRLGEAQAEARGIRRTVRLGCVGQGAPRARQVEGEGEAGLQIRLIETGERLMRPGRHEQRVEEISLPVQRHVSRGELDRDVVHTHHERVGGQDDVTVDQRWRYRASTNGQAADRCGSRKVERKGARGICEGEVDIRAAPHGQLLLVRDLEREAVADVRDPSGPICCERRRNPGLGIVRRRAEAFCHHDHCHQAYEQDGSHAAFSPEKCVGRQPDEVQSCTPHDVDPRPLWHRPCSFAVRRTKEMNRDELEGKAESLKGKVKQAAGDLTDNERLHDEGVADEVSGDTKDTLGRARRKVGEAIEDVGENIKR